MLKSNTQSIPVLNKNKPLIKPLESIKRLLEIIKSTDESFILEEQKMVSFSEHSGRYYVYLFTEGYFSVQRDSDGMCVLSEEAPLVVGTSIMLMGYCQGNYTIAAQKKCIGYRIPCDEAKARINQLNLWSDVAELMAYIIQLYIQRDKYVAGVDAYTMIRYNLLKLNEFCDEDRMHINVEKFIHKRTHLSRSGIMKILSDLKTGGYITIVKGRLISIKRLPESY